MTVIIVAVLVDHNLFGELWYLALVPYGAFIPTGGPMLFFQEMKRRELDYHSKIVLTDIELQYGKKWLEYLKPGPKR